MPFGRSSALAVASLLALMLPALALADADAERGRKLTYTCYGCHGIANYKNVYPTYSVPKLQGQHPEYLVAALTGYRSGDRAHATMHAQASTMTDQDMQDIAAFLSGKPLVASPDAKPKGEVPKKAQELCVSCHGPDGISIAAIYPTLAGQHADYIQRALLDYKSGARKNAIMGGFVADLTPEQIRELAHFFSSQGPGLSTAEHAHWFTQEKTAEKSK